MTEVVARRCRDHDGDDRSLRIALVEDLRQRVPFRAHVWALIDPVTEVSTSPLATVPDELMAQVHGMIRRRFGLWGWLDLWRFAHDDAFTDSELAVLAEDVPVITTALRGCQARSFDEATPVPDRSGPAVLFLSPDLEVRGQTPETDAYLRTLLPPDADRQPISATAYNVGAALLAREAGIDDHAPVARIRLVGGVWLTVRAARVDSDRPPAEREIAVTIELATPAERRAVYTRSHGLTERETELVDRLADGAGTSEIAEAMFLSEHTVQDHLKSIFAKTRTRNRRTLLSRVAGQ